MKEEPNPYASPIPEKSILKSAKNKVDLYAKTGCGRFIITVIVVVFVYLVIKLRSFIYDNYIDSY